jgi:hypothetical protein
MEEHTHGGMENIAYKVKQHIFLAGGTHRMAFQLTNEIINWVTNNGPRYAVKRLKQLKLALIHKWAGDRDWGTHAPWFKRSKDKKGLYGPFRHLFKSNPSSAHIRYALSVCGVQYFFTFGDETLEEEKEVVENITNPYTGTIPEDKIQEVVDKVYIPYWSGKRIKNPSTVIKPDFTGLTTAKPESKTILMNPEGAPNPWLSSLVWTSLQSFPHDHLLDTTGIKTSPLRPYSGPVGNLAFLKEGGFKLRMVCVPHSEVQVVLMPLHRKLQEFLNGFSEDCTLNQEKGALWCRSQLRKGKTLHSVDLKSATDRLPRKLQYALALDAGLSPRWVQVFESLVSFGFSVHNDHVHYAVGQPMGFAGSFPFLALCQHGLVRLAAANLRISAQGQYVVLGDDVVISNDSLHLEYRRLLKAFGVPVSEHKCISSNRLAEFAGYVITSQGIYKGTKMATQINLDRLVSYCQTQGKIPKALRKVSSLVPLVYGLKEHGGLGLNPLGLSKQDRARWYDDIRGTEIDLTPRKKGKTYESLRAYLNRLLYSFEEGPSDGKVIQIHHVYRNAVHFVLNAYLEELELIMKSKLAKTKFKFLSPMPGVFQHAALEDESFLVGMSPYEEAVPATRKWVREKFPYWFLLISEYTSELPEQLQEHLNM